ncbi:hypothetical protein SIN8267_01255 [Sinobacterium norvegicum]|uniref:FHA domain-containing protein n=1 Tax=Sinobacterium norvegicum TaxID=1641715 RepID=A0ABM9ADN7_9GAMM|nr:FHA domain-containing protein [Sinobacterium norvegicum]CAH0991153.1 hypothetical protein SIN8267_01255 [Sinobacterium norvegicum]
MTFLVQMIDDVVSNQFEIGEGEVTIGRKLSNDICIGEESVSSFHAKITVEKNIYFDNILDVYIEDLNSTNGTYVNDVQLRGRQKLSNNDEIKLAWNVFKYIDNTDGEMEQTTFIAQ